jgi:cytochrome c556
LDKHHVKDPTEHPTYEKYAIEFRTAAAELNKAVHAADQAAALKAFARMDQSCHTCHQKYVQPKK